MQQSSLRAAALKVLARNSVNNTCATNHENHATNHATNEGDFVASDTTQHPTQHSFEKPSASQAQQGVLSVALEKGRKCNTQHEALTIAATEACTGLTDYITPAVLLAKLGSADVAELESCADPLPFLRSFAIACVWTDFRRDGIAPPTWDQPATCDKCGPVFLWAPISVAGCPWCWNRLHKVKIPRPPVLEVVL